MKLVALSSFVLDGTIDMSGDDGVDSGGHNHQGSGGARAVRSTFRLSPFLALVKAWWPEAAGLLGTTKGERGTAAVEGALLYTALAPDRLLVGFLFVEAQNGQEMLEEDQVRYTRTV